jgi:hypothetical protein
MLFELNLFQNLIICVFYLRIGKDFYRWNALYNTANVVDRRKTWCSAGGILLACLSVAVGSSLCLRLICVRKLATNTMVISCPTCGNSFDTRKQFRQHYYRSKCARIDNMIDPISTTTPRCHRALYRLQQKVCFPTTRTLTPNRGLLLDCW